VHRRGYRASGELTCPPSAVSLAQAIQDKTS
jgi:hypothetical protein